MSSGSARNPWLGCYLGWNVLEGGDSIKAVRRWSRRAEEQGDLLSAFTLAAMSPIPVPTPWYIDEKRHPFLLFFVFFFCLFLKLLRYHRFWHLKWMVSLVCTDFDGLYLCCDVNCDQMTAKNAAKEFYFYKPKPPPNGKTWRCG